MSEELTPWQKYKQNLGESRPWHLLNSDNYVEESLQKQRMSICSQCPEIIKPVYQCKKCGCFMKGKTMLKNATCPIDKW